MRRAWLRADIRSCRGELLAASAETYTTKVEADLARIASSWRCKRSETREIRRRRCDLSGSPRCESCKRRPAGEAAALDILAALDVNDGPDGRRGYRHDRPAHQRPNEVSGRSR